MDLGTLQVTNSPARHQDCCLSFSVPLFDTLVTTILDDTTQPRHPPKRHRRHVLSIGSGSGLLEALLQRYLDSLSPPLPGLDVEVEGIEVYPGAKKGPVNKYLSEQATSTVRGTWDLSPRLQDPDAYALMFVYPRQPGLVTRYIRAVLEQDLAVRVVVWLGPMADWAEFQACFALDDDHGVPLFSTRDIREGADAGLQAYEMMAILKRR